MPKKKIPEKNDLFPISSSTHSFIRKFSIAYGNYKSTELKDTLGMFCSMVKSPIEQIFFISLQTLVIINGSKCFKIIFNDKDGNEKKGIIRPEPQVKIGNYFVDFLICLIIDKKIYRKVIVECDSQEFHERTEKERRYEKARDRFLINEGYTVFHFTGTKIMNEPFRVAAEVISYLTDQDISKINQCKDYF